MFERYSSGTLAFIARFGAHTAERQQSLRILDGSTAAEYAQVTDDLCVPGVTIMAGRHLVVRRQVAASRASVWAVCADFPNLANHWSGLKSSRPLGDQTQGVGARRQVKLKPLGSLVETVTAWEEGSTLATMNQPSALVPFKQAEATLALEPAGGGTMITFDYRYVPRGGPTGGLTGPLIDRMLRTNFEHMLAAIEETARRAD